MPVLGPPIFTVSTPCFPLPLSSSPLPSRATTICEPRAYARDSGAAFALYKAPLGSHVSKCPCCSAGHLGHSVRILLAKGSRVVPTPAFLPAPTERTPPHPEPTMPPPSPSSGKYKPHPPDRPSIPDPSPDPPPIFPPSPTRVTLYVLASFWIALHILKRFHRFPPLISLASLLLHARSSLSQVTGFFLDTPDCPLPHLQPFLFIFCSHLPPWVDHLLTNLSRLPPRDLSEDLPQVIFEPRNSFTTLTQPTPTRSSPPLSYVRAPGIVKTKEGVCLAVPTFPHYRSALTPLHSHPPSRAPDRSFESVCLSVSSSYL